MSVHVLHCPIKELVINWNQSDHSYPLVVLSLLPSDFVMKKLNFSGYFFNETKNTIKKHVDSNSQWLFLWLSVRSSKSMPRNFHTTTQRPVCSLHLRWAFFCQLSHDFRESGFTFPRDDYIIQYVRKELLNFRFQN